MGQCFGRWVSGFVRRRMLDRIGAVPPAVGSELRRSIIGFDAKASALVGR
ncbi:hypothetical protein MMEU_0727 [Mycobacterium marinum str. Europe]|nr:hypothetical protein MMEU_0727 [Mycobacterium marinum str. Europe]